MSLIAVVTYESFVVRVLVVLAVAVAAAADASVQAMECRTLKALLLIA